MLFVLLGIVLFAALTYTFSRTNRTAAKISFEDAQLNAQKILSYAEKLNGAVQTISLQNSCLASQISFENTTIAGYANATSPANKKCHVFDSAGGGMTYEAPPAVALDTAAAALALTVPFPAGNLVGQYVFAGDVCLDGVSTGPLATCATDGLQNEELLLILPWVSLEVCTVINQILGNTAAIMQDSGGGFDSTKFTGTYADGFALGNAGFTTYPIGCYKSTNAGSPGAGYHFYYTLISR